MDTIRRVEQTIRRYGMLPAGTVVVGVSGGADSVALLHILLRLRDELALTVHVAHLNHGIRGADADADAAFVDALARAWGVSCVVGSADVPALARDRKLAIEEAARQARYAFLLSVARQTRAGAVAVAHQADDQAETLLMHFLRGAGLAGMRGILPVSDLTKLHIGEPRAAHGDPVRLVRPLLDIGKADILQYCRDNGLDFRFDRSNLDQTHFRNRLRHELLPVLEKYNPNIRNVLRRSAMVAADDYALLLRHLRRAWDRTLISHGGGWLEFDLHRWRRLPRSHQRGILREAIRRLRHGLRNINWVHVESALDVLSASDAGEATLPQGLAAFARYGRLYVAEAAWSPPPDAPQLAGAAVAVPVPGRLVLPDGRWAIETSVLDSAPPEARDNPDRWQAWLDLAAAGTDLVIRPRRAGETFLPMGMGGRTKRITDLMINEKIPREWRANWPLLCNSSQVLWVAGLRLDDRAAVTPATGKVLWARIVPDQE